jgi:mgtE-like transporter
MLVKEMIKQSLPLLVICGIGGLIAGNTLGLMTDLFENIPGLIVVIPGIIALRGSISTAFGSRLGSAYHLGVIDENNMWNDELRQNILGSFILSFSMSAIIGVLAFVTSVLMGANPDGLKLVTIVLIAGVLSALILTGLTVSIVFVVFKRGWDPDNVTGPALTTFGDIVTMVCIFASALFVEGLL